MRTHRLFGLTLASDFPFAHRLAAGTGIPDFTFCQVAHPPIQAGSGSGLRLYSSPFRAETGESVSVLDRFPEMEVLRFPGTADFHLKPGRITGHLLDPSRKDLMELRLLGPVFSYWLERLGICALHASAVRLAGRAVGFVADHSCGKSSLAAALVRTGAPLLTDDVLPVEERDGTFVARPGYPEMRMEPDAARHFLGGIEGLSAVSRDDSKLHVPVGPDGFGSFETSALPLACLYLFERSSDPGAQVESAPLSKRQAVIALVRHSFSPFLVEAVGLQSRRLDFFGRLVNEVPVRKIVFPDGWDGLERAADALAEAV